MNALILKSGWLFLRRAIMVTFVAFSVVFSQHSWAQYPEKPIRLIVPYVAGGTPDFIARSLEPVLSSRLGQRIIIDNRPGAGGLVGTEIAAKAVPDGYTLVVGGTSSFCVTPVLQAKNRKYDVMGDFTHVALLAQSQLLVVSHPSLPARNVKELIALAKRHPGKLSYGSSGNGTTPHMLGELFKHYAAVNIQHIPYKGGPQAWTAVISGEIELLVGQVQQAIPQLNAGKIRAYAVFGGKRSPALPNIPTFEEARVKSLDVVIWYSIAVPAKTEKAVVSRLNAEINYALSASDAKARLTGAGLDPLPSAPDESTRFISSEIPRWTEAVRISGAKVD